MRKEQSPRENPESESDDIPLPIWISTLRTLRQLNEMYETRPTDCERGRKVLAKMIQRFETMKRKFADKASIAGTRTQPGEIGERG